MEVKISRIRWFSRLTSLLASASEIPLLRLLMWFTLEGETLWIHVRMNEKHSKEKAGSWPGRMFHSCWKSSCWKEQFLESGRSRLSKSYRRISHYENWLLPEMRWEVHWLSLLLRESQSICKEKSFRVRKRSYFFLYGFSERNKTYLRLSFSIWDITTVRHPLQVFH